MSLVVFFIIAFIPLKQTFRNTLTRKEMIHLKIDFKVVFIVKICELGVRFSCSTVAFNLSLQTQEKVAGHCSFSQSIVLLKSVSSGRESH